MRRPMNWGEKLLADHADEQFSIDTHFRGRAEVEASKWWYAWERFADSMRTLTQRIENSSLSDENPLDTRERIRDYGPSDGHRVRHKWEEPRQ